MLCVYVLLLCLCVPFSNIVQFASVQFYVFEVYMHFYVLFVCIQQHLSQGIQLITISCVFYVLFSRQYHICFHFHHFLEIAGATFHLLFFLSECVVCFPIKRNGTHSIQAHIFDYFLRFSILIKHVRWGRRKGGRTLAMRIYNAKWEGGSQ